MANKHAKIAFFNAVNSTINKNLISAKKKFKILQKLMKNNKFSSISPLNENDKIINDSGEKAKIFNNHFASKSNLNGKEDDPPFLQKKDFPELSLLNTSPLEVGKLIRTMKKSHISPCGISAKFLQLISLEISYALSKLFNNLFETGHFPDVWKIAHVTPIFKRNGSKNCRTNYRPISILPTLSKICESVIHERLLSHCITNNVITDRQAAYLKGDSTISQLLYLVYQIRLSWGIGKIAHGSFLDISAAFDKVWHKCLICEAGVTHKNEDHQHERIQRRLSSNERTHTRRDAPTIQYTPTNGHTYFHRGGGTHPQCNPTNGHTYFHRRGDAPTM